jgi:hypothetical protein
MAEGVVVLGPRDIPVDEALGSRAGLLEEHVLQGVGQAELRRGLVAAAHAHPQLNRDHPAGAKLLLERNSLMDDAAAVRKNWRMGAWTARGGCGERLAAVPPATTSATSRVKHTHLTRIR